MRLKVTSVEIKDVLGAKEFAIEPGTVTVLSGENATGKSTALEALKTAIGGGSLAKMQRISDPGNLFDEDPNAEVVLVLDGEDGEHYLVEKGPKSVRVRQRVGDTAGLEDVPKPQRWLSGLHDGRLSNPIEFIRAAEKDRVLLLLEALPVKFDQNDRFALWDRMGLYLGDFPAIPDGLHPVTELAMVRENVFRERTGVNRDAKGKSESAEQTRRATPAVLPEGHEEEIKELAEQVRVAENDITRKISEAKSEYREGEKELKSTHLQWAAEKRAQLEADITESKAIVDERVTVLESQKDTALEDLLDEQQEIETGRSRLSVLREQAKTAIKARTLKEQADRFETEAEELKEKSAALTEAIKTLDRVRRELLDDCPIQGLEVDGKTITIDGVPFDQTNTAEQIKIAVKVACLRAQDNPMPIVFVDGAEALDSKHFSALCDALEEEGVQAFIGRVDDKPFSVSTR